MKEASDSNSEIVHSFHQEHTHKHIALPEVPDTMEENNHDHSKYY